MKKLVMFILVGLFLVGFLGFIVADVVILKPSEVKESPSGEKVFKFTITAKTINNNSEEEIDDDNETDIESNDEENETEECEAWTCTKWGACVNNVKTRTCTAIANCVSDDTEPKLSKKCDEKEKIKPNGKRFECPENCTCTGSVTKCILADGTREMTIRAGKSGNVIVQVKGVNASTSVTLYKDDDGKFYTVNKENETKRIRYMPDQIRERIREKLERQFENENMTLDEEGDYDYEGEKNAKLFFLFSVKVPVIAKVDAETGEIIKVKSPWWAFLAKDDEGEGIAGASCGTVTPGENDNCCINKGYNFWNATEEECQFNVGD